MADPLENSTLAVRTEGDDRQALKEELIVPPFAEDDPLLAHHYDNILEICNKYEELKKTFAKNTSAGDDPPSPICGSVAAAPRKENIENNDQRQGES
ncbi:hypothetical protein BSKO_07861 [Bryopsis sp. KO-2023]|nr:hypothetical protein BSKO_07861 [Bryopsis sp. KO-2023]